MDDGEAGAGERWAREADERERNLPKLGPYPIPGLVRRVRRVKDLSQRQLAQAVGVSPSTVGRIEAASITPTLDLLQRILAVAGFRLVAVDEAGHVVLPMRDVDDVRGGAGRFYPAHLDVIHEPRPGEWWGDEYGLARPPGTYYRDRGRRDAMRELTGYEVRLQAGTTAPAPESETAARIRELQDRILARPKPWVGWRSPHQDADLEGFYRGYATPPEREDEGGPSAA